MALTTTTTMAPSMVTYYQRQLLPIVQEDLVWNLFGVPGRIPRKNGKVTQWRKYDVLAEASQLTEGVVPAGKALSQTQVTATRKPYGDYVTITDEVEDLAIDEVMEDAVPLLIDQIGRTADTEQRTEICGGTSVRYVGGHTARNQLTASDTLTWDILRQVHRDMRLRGVPVIRSLGGTYALVIGSGTKYDLMDDAKFANVVNSNTSDPQRRLELNQIGVFYGFTVFETNRPFVDAGVGVGGVDAHVAMAIGDGAYGIPVWDEPKLYPKGFGSAGTQDPINQLASVGWKGAWVTKRLQELFMERIEHVIS